MRGPKATGTGNNDDPSVAASYAHDEANGSESYEAGANLSQGGALFATASRSGDLAAGTGSPRAAATFSETIFIDEVPSGPIVIRASFGVDVEATALGGFGAVAQANARLTLNAFAGHLHVRDEREQRQRPRGQLELLRGRLLRVGWAGSSSP